MKPYQEAQWRAATKTKPSFGKQFYASETIKFALENWPSRYEDEALNERSRMEFTKMLMALAKQRGLDNVKKAIQDIHSRKDTIKNPGAYLREALNRGPWLENWTSHKPT